MGRLEELLAQYLDGALPAAEARELADRLRSDREAAQTFFALYRQERLLMELHRNEDQKSVEAIMAEIAQEENAYVGTVMTTVRTESQREAQPPLSRIAGWPSWLRGRALAWSGTGLALAGLAVYFFGATVGEPALVIDPTPQGTLERAGETMPLSRGLKLQAGDVLRVAGTNPATISYAPERSYLQLEPGTTLRVEAWNRGKRFKLDQGKLEAAVARQRPFQPLIIVTPNAEARVLGTRFTLTATNDLTELDVTQGKVWLADTANSSNLPVTVSAGHHARVALATVLAALPATGHLTREWWNGVSWVLTSDTLDDPRFPIRPDGRDLIDRFEITPATTNRFGARLRGYVHPPVTGDYQFWIAAATSAQLFLSPDERPARKTALATAYSGMKPREWDAPRPPGDGSSSRSGLIRLEAGRRYYIEAILTVPKGEGHLSVAWKRPGANRELLTGNYLSPASAKE